MDLNMIDSLESMKNRSGWRDLVCKMSDITKTCRPLELKECHIQKLRSQVGVSSVCPGATEVSCPCIDRDCKDSATFKDEKGYFCDTWIGDDCTTASTRWGFSAAGQSALIQNCPRSCNTCTWHSPCPYKASSSCTSSSSKPPAF